MLYRSITAQRFLTPCIQYSVLDLNTCSVFPFCLSFFSLQGRHVKTGQLAAIKVMDVTGVRLPHTHLDAHIASDYISIQLVI